MQHPYLTPGVQQTSNVAGISPFGHSAKQPSSGCTWSGFEQHRWISEEFVLMPKQSGFPLPTTSQWRRYVLHKNPASSALVEKSRRREKMVIEQAKIKQGKEVIEARSVCTCNL
jgi:hypothetical protein